MQNYKPTNNNKLLDYRECSLTNNTEGKEGPLIRHSRAVKTFCNPATNNLIDLIANMLSLTTN
jgi:hypothetical protein